ncbi:hypothetical protein FHR99_002894 [Litorivivens lipolytica]|uniref:Cadherin domain-containing protein n=1 Tax=Litorivivens lipolytica TaxID=1524264 RepID=A0A7W4Z834_9GAMM|nr:hypothetical protein [Litorivivens lipolytica]
MNSLMKTVGGLSFFRILVVAGLLLSAVHTQASHFRFGHFTYQSRQDVAPAAADFAMTVAFRSSAFGHPGIGQTFRPGRYNFGDGRSANLNYRVIARNLQEDWIVGRAIDSSGNDLIRHIYPSVDNNGNPWLGQFSSCCKIGGIRNASNASWRVYTRVDLTSGNSSPLSNLPPIVSCSKYDCRFLIPAVDPDRDKITWRLSTRSESAIPSIPSGMQVDRDTGVFTWAGAQSFSNGLYSVQVTLEDRDDNDVVKSTAAIDFLIRLQDQGANIAPAFDHPPTPEAGSRIKAVVGQTLSIAVQASDADSNDTVYLNHVGLPNRATFEQSISGGRIGLAHLEWTPTESDIGEHIVTFLANDNRGGASSPVSVTIEVIKPAISDVRVRSRISADDVDVDTSSLSKPPSSIGIEGDRTVVTWEFATFSVDQLENLSKNLRLYNVEPGEIRVVTEQLEVSYIDIDGNPVHQSLGEQRVKVAPTLTSVSVATDKPSYTPSEQVIVSSTIMNLASVKTDAPVSIIVTDTQQNIAADLGSFNVEALQAQETRGLPNLNFSAADVYAGSYLAIARILDERGKVLRQASAPFSVTTQSGELATISALVSTDKPVYRAWDQAIVDLRALNNASNATFNGGNGVMTVYRPDGSLLESGTYVINSLAPSANEDRQHILRLEDREPGAYRVVWQIKQAEEILAESETQFTVERAALESLIGEIEVEHYPTGEPKSCQFVATNRSSSELDNATLIYQVIALESGEVLYQTREGNLALEAGASHPYTLILSDPPAYGDYGCILMAEIDEELRQLAAAGFQVIPPNLEVQVQAASKGRLLVLLDADDYQAPRDTVAPALQREYLERLLTENGWNYTLTSTPESFANEFNSGGYSSIAILSEATTLHPQVEALLAEAQNSATGLLISGSWNRRNSQLERSLGIALTGKNNQAHSIDVMEGVLANAAEDSPPVSAGLALAHCGAQVWAAFSVGKNASHECANLDGPAAVTVASYGLGRHAYFAYDALDSAAAQQGLHEQLLLAALETIQPRTWPLAPGRIVPLEISIENQSRRAALDVVITLPNGGQVVDTTGVYRHGDDTWLWQQDLSAPTAVHKIIYIQLPESSSDSLPVLVDIHAGINRSLMVNDSEFALSLAPIDAGLSFGNAISLMQSLLDQYPQDKDYDFIDKKLRSAEADIHQGKTDNAIKSLLLATDRLEKKVSAQALDLRLAVDRVLYQLQRTRSSISFANE